MATQRESYLIEQGLAVTAAAQQIANGLQVLKNAQILRNSGQVNFDEIPNISDTPLGYLTDSAKDLNNAIDQAQNLDISQILKLAKL